MSPSVKRANHRCLVTLQVQTADQRARTDGALDREQRCQEFTFWATGREQADMHTSENSCTQEKELSMEM